MLSFGVSLILSVDCMGAGSVWNESQNPVSKVAAAEIHSTARHCWERTAKCKRRNNVIIPVLSAARSAGTRNHARKTTQPHSGSEMYDSETCYARVQEQSKYFGKVWRRIRCDGFGYETIAAA